MEKEYGLTKFLAHDGVVESFQNGGQGRLLSVHLMPQNLCNQSCAFCAYRMLDNKNSEDFNDNTHIPWHQMLGLLEDLHQMGVQGIEVTGGGEPLAYPYIGPLFRRMNELGFATALVSNGTLMRDHVSSIVPNLRWARISIDAARPRTYSIMRRTREEEFVRAWGAVRQLRGADTHPEFKLGVGFVLSNENYSEVYETAKLAKEAGADNVRLSATYSSHGRDYYTPEAQGQFPYILESAARAKDELESEGFTVHDLLTPRLADLDEHMSQDYQRCPTKDLLCVIEGEGKVYTCCTLTGSLKGYQGSIYEKGFKTLWEEKAPWRKQLDARKLCNVVCLYRDHNLAMNRIIDEAPDVTAEMFDQIVHKEFI